MLIYNIIILIKNSTRVALLLSLSSVFIALTRNFLLLFGLKIFLNFHTKRIIIKSCYY